MAHRDEIARLEAMHAANPEGRVFAHLAEAYRKMGELERARTVLQTGLERHPGYASAHVVMGRVMLDLREPDAADDAFRKVLELDPHNMVALRGRGDIAHNAGRRHDALAFYRELTSLDPSDEQTALRIAEIETGPAAPLADAPVLDEAGVAESSESDFGYVEVAPHAEETPATIDETPAAMDEGPAAIDETPAAMDEAPAVTNYGEAALPTSEETDSIEEPFAPTEDVPLASFERGDEVDLGLGGRLEPTDLGGAPETPRETAREPEAAPAGPREGTGEPLFDAVQPAEPAAVGGAIEPEDRGQEDDPARDSLALLGAFEPAGETEPDATLDLAGTVSDFALPEPADSAADTSAEDFELPGFDEIAGDATPMPTAPAEEPAPAPASSAPPDASLAPTVDNAADFESLWTAYDDGVSAELPEGGPELITETIGDLYAQQGLHERAADVYSRLLETRGGNAGLQAKLDAARARAAEEAAAATSEDTPSPQAADAATSVDTPSREPELPSFEDLGLETVGGGAFYSPPDVTAASDAFAAPEGFESVGGGDPTGAPPIEPDEVEPVSQPDWLIPFSDPEAVEAAPETEAFEPPGTETAGLESVESAWTGGAGASADVESPFGWAEPESPSEQSTIGDYLDGLIAFRPSEAPAAAEAPAAVETPAQPETPARREAPAHAEARAQADAEDDIDFLFADVEDSPATPAVAESAAADDIDSLFDDDTAPPMQTADGTDAFAWDPFAELSGDAPAPGPTAPSPRPPAPPSPPAPTASSQAGADDGGWDPFAELPEEAPPAPAKPAAETQPPAGDAGDDDEDIDMFRAWLQSLKR